MMLRWMLPLFVAAVCFAEGGAEGVTPFEGTVPVEARLTGDLPVGRWQCWTEEWPIEEVATSNVRFPPPGCNVQLFTDASGVEFRPGGVGFILGIKRRGPDKWYTYRSSDYNDDAEFDIVGVPISRFSRVKEIRWAGRARR